jgi:putative ABC transport system permease protein
MSILSIFSYVLKRLWSHSSLAACLALGLIASVSLAVAVPLYADGVNYNLLNAALSRTAAETRRPAFSFIFHYVGAWHNPIEMAKYEPVDAFMREQAAQIVGLPLGQYGSDQEAGVTRYVSTENLQLYPQGNVIRRSERLELVKLTYMSGVFEHVRLIDGKLPSRSGEDSIEALMPLKLANDLGLHVGETYLLYKPDARGTQPFRMQVTVAGLWVPQDPQDGFWFYPPDSLDKRLLVPEETFFRPVAAQLALPVDEAAWRLAFDGSGVHSQDVPSLLARIDQVQTRANALLPYTDLEFSPVQALRQYRGQSQALTGLLFAFSSPVLGLALYFLGLTAAMLVRRQRNEIAVLRSRGASRPWVAGIYGLEWSMLSGLALLTGPWLGMALARLVGQTRSFLDFSLKSPFSLSLTRQALGFGLTAAALALLFSLLPAWQSGRFTIVSYKQERARARQKPLWQRFYLDLLLLVPPLYGLYTLRSQGKIMLLGRSLGASNPFENPLLFLLPALFILALSLLLLRLLPRLLSGLSWLAAQFPGTVPVLALRQLSRSAGAHMAPLMLLVITLSLAGFVASMAHTLDRSLTDGVYYQVGADLNLVEGGEYTGETQNPAEVFSQAGASGTIQVPVSTDLPAVWNFLPVSDHLSLPGVQAVARVGRYDAELQAGGRSAGGNLLAIDRTDFPRVAFFRRDFASEPLIALMNRLAYDPAALLVDRGTWERFNLNTGDPVQLRIRLEQRQTLEFKVAGVMEYFPTQYPEQGPFFVANLDYLFESTGGLQPYDVWLRTAQGADPRAIVQGVNNLGVAVIRAQDARLLLDQTFQTPNRQGVLGLLSVGFLSALLLNVVGFLLYALFSFRERYIQLGVLRAIGLSGEQMAAYLALEQFFLILTGLGVGTGIAVLAAYLFIPHLAVTFGSHPGVPPSVVEIAWGDMLRVYAVFGGMLLAGVGVTLFMLRRMRLFQAIKMGENA